MFTLADPDQVYKHEVVVHVPIADGQQDKQSFIAHFKLLPRSKFKALFSEQSLQNASDDYEVISYFLTGWEQIKKHDGQALEFSEQTLMQLSDIAYWARAVLTAYIEFYSGIPEKN